MKNPQGSLLEGSQVLLRPIVETDYRTLFEWRTDTEWLYLWSHPRRLISFAEYVTTLERSLHGDIDVWLMMIAKDGSKPIGFVYTYDTSTWDSFTYVVMFVTPEARGKHRGLEGGALFVRYLMDYFPFRKLYADVFEFNHVSQTFITHYGFEEEGTFPAHRYYQGQYWSMLRLALYREKWEAIRPTLFPAQNNSYSADNTARITRDIADGNSEVHRSQ